MAKFFSYSFLQEVEVDGETKMISSIGGLNVDRIVDIKVKFLVQETMNAQLGKPEPINALHVYVYLAGQTTKAFQPFHNPQTDETEWHLTDVPYFVLLTKPEDVQTFLGLQKVQNQFKLLQQHSRQAKMLRAWLQGETPASPTNISVVKEEEE